MAIDTKTREEPKTVLQDMEVHDQWIGHFRSAENEPFYDLAFDYIARQFGDPSQASVLDAGCGSATKTLHLAKRGYRVLGLDLSESILENARAAVKKAGLESKVEFRRADLTQIDLPAAGMSRGICWGVLMHIPAVDKAVAELARVIAPGGTLIISEGNQYSLQAIGLRTLKKLLGKERAELIRTPAGIEFWEETSTGRFMTRQANIPWLIREFEKHGLKLETRRAGQFTEIFTVVPWRPVRLLIHAVNNAWFRILPWAAPSFGNILVFRRPM
jgi:2-polyprenyl-3-methyl-5-hydroxy-6-metoxy-1,4-benzoquinol methylase